MKTSWGRLRLLPLAIVVSAALSLGACGGGGGSGTAGESPPPLALGEPDAPQLTGNTATDAFNRFNFRRQQMGLPVLTRNAAIDVAAQGHSDYQRINNVTTHAQDFWMPGFTGNSTPDRLRAAGYVTPRSGYALGEVVSSRASTNGADAADDLVGSIYDRFTIFEPMFKEAGAGAASGATWFTEDFAAIGLDGGLAAGQVAVYPWTGQTGVPSGVDTDGRSPDPVPNQNRVGYPVSVHANLTSTLAVQSFTIRPRGGAALAVRTLTPGSDPDTPRSAAAIVPLAVLSPATTYDVQFTGTVDGAAVARSWSFTTQ